MISRWRLQTGVLARTRGCQNGILVLILPGLPLHACKLHLASLLDALSLEVTPLATQSHLEFGGVFAPLREGLEGRALLQPVTPTTTLSAGDPLALLHMIVDHLGSFLDSYLGFLALLGTDLEVGGLLRN